MLKSIFYILDKDNKVVPAKDVLEWAEFVKNDLSRIIAFDSVGKTDISTIFIGLASLPIDRLFETAVIEGDKLLTIEPYQTYQEALEGHKRAFEKQLKKLEIINEYFRNTKTND